MFKDIDRIDRLITDISFSSRLDADLGRTKFKNANLNKQYQILGKHTIERINEEVTRLSATKT